MTASTGVGRGVGSGGARANAGRKRGGRNRHTAARLAQVQEKTRTDPLDFLIRVMDDEKFQARDRVTAGIALLPYFHTRLSAAKILPNVALMSDAELVRLMEQISERLGEPSAADRARSLENQADELITAVEELSPHKQRALLHQLATATQAKLHELEKPQPGDVLPRNSRASVIDHAPAAKPPPGPNWADGTPARSGQRLRYDPETDDLLPVADRG